MIIPALLLCSKIRQTKMYVNTNTDELLAECDKATRPAFPRVPNQVDEKYYYVDISCDTDINLHWNDYD
jgi:hypothetical protein